MKKIILTQNKVALVDDEDYNKINSFNWCASKTRGYWRAKRSGGIINGKYKEISMTRQIMGIDDERVVDHINGDRLDNRKTNLRVCTHRQNCQNRINCQDNNILGIKGVCFVKSKIKFIARIKINGKTKHLGYFNVLGDADSAYRIAEKKYFGDFARQSSQ